MGTRGRPAERIEAVPSPNIWRWPELYEVENRAQDVDGDIWRALREVCGPEVLTGVDLVDVGCGDGFHLPFFAATARSVLGVEPHPPLVERARRRTAGLPGVQVLAGGAQRLPLPDASVDLVHARTAYFFGPGCEPGLAEAERVLRPGGTLVIVDLDGHRAPYGDWLRADVPHYDPDGVEGFFARLGFSCRRIDTTWRFDDRDSLAAVLRIEFARRIADRALAEVADLSFTVGYRLHVRRKPVGLLSGRAAGHHR